MRYQVEINAEPYALFEFFGDAINWADLCGLTDRHKSSEIVVLNILTDEFVYELRRDRYAYEIG